MKEKKETIKVGLLHSMSGHLATYERTVLDMELMAIKELNEKGGVLGKLIEPIIADGMSSPEVFAREAERLIKEQGVKVIFGCWTSSCRKAVKEVVEKHDSLLFYPIQNEGLEISDNVVFIGSIANQQIVPAVLWCVQNIGKRFFLVGSDYVFPHAAHEITKDYLHFIGGEVVGEEYIVLGDRKVDSVVQKIVQQQPDVILNTINGDTNISFFQELRKAGVTSDKIPTMSLSLGESDFDSIGFENVAGDYAASSYFQSISSQENTEFIQRVRKRYGAKRVISESDHAGYASLFVWAMATNLVQSTEAQKVRGALKFVSLRMPEGTLYMDVDFPNAWKMLRVGKITQAGQFVIVWDSEEPITPKPYPFYRSREKWDTFLHDLYLSWGGSWENNKKND